MLTTKQEIFDIVAPHLVRQGRQSSAASGLCAYRGQEGRMCAVGILIPDERYEPRLEGRLVNRSSVKTALSGKVTLSLENENFLYELQQLHDGSGDYYDEHGPLTESMNASYRWKNQLTDLAKRHNLKSDCLEGVTTEYKGPNHVDDNARSF